MPLISCRFCEVTDALRSTSLDKSNFWDSPLFETDNFFVVPSLGALVEGWLLIVTKEHHLCMGSLSLERIIELENITRIVSDIVESKYGPIAIFEHGPSTEHLPVGCGVDHAHLHIVPFEPSLTKTVGSLGNSIMNWSPVIGLTATRDYFLNKISYLYLHQKNSGSFIHADVNIPSQLFRKTIAEYHDKIHEYNWREYAQLDKIASTIEHLKPAFQNLNLVVK